MTNAISATSSLREAGGTNSSGDMEALSDLEVLLQQVIYGNNCRIDDVVEAEHSLDKDIYRKASEDAQPCEEIRRLESPPKRPLSCSDRNSSKLYSIQAEYEAQSVQSVVHDEFSLMSTDESVSSTDNSDSDFNVNEEDSQLSNTSAEIPSEDLEALEAEARKFTKKRRLERQLVFSRRNREKRNLRSTGGLQQISKEKMVASQKENSRPQPWSEKQKSSGNKRHTRSKKKNVTDNGSSNIYCIGTTSLATSNHGKSQIVVDEQSKGSRIKGKPLRPVIEDVLIGKKTNVVADVEELRKKREEDAIRCGRILRKVGNAVTVQPGVHAGLTSLAENNVDRNQAVVDSLQCRRSSTVRQNERNAVIEDIQDEEDVERNRPLHFEVKKPSDTQSNKIMGMPNNCNRTLPRCAIHEALLNSEMNPTALEPLTEEDEEVGRHRRSVSPTFHSGNNERRCIGERNMLPTNERWSHHERSSNVDSPDVQAHGYVRRVTSRSPQTGRSTSPAFQKTVQERRSSAADNADEGTRELRVMISNGPGSEEEDERREELHRRSRKSSRSNRGYDNGRFISPNKTARRRGQSLTPSRSQSRSPSVGGENRLRKRAKYMEERSPNDETVPVASPSIDRRTRRYKQKVRDAEVSKRHKEGKKAFYLTVDGQGKPYGPGRQAWITHVNKLASGLDPSCTHIRKQTHEDMCILKERLNDNFEYSRDLNEDYLRGLLDKAVTRNRSELISQIRRGASQPKHFDREVWERLEKLASSRQRESKEEQGRNASARRKTFGRTGPLGEEGVRERLRQLRGRSPDYEEVAEEMQRDKGFGKAVNVTAPGCRLKGDGSSRHKVLDEDATHVQLKTTQSQEYKMGGNQRDRLQLLRQVGVETNEQVDRLNRMNNNNIPARNRIEVENPGFVFEKQFTKDDYIAQLESQIQMLKGDPGPTSALLMLSRSDTDGRGRHYSEGISSEYAPNVSTVSRSAQRRAHEGISEEHFEVDDL